MADDAETPGWAAPTAPGAGSRPRVSDVCGGPFGPKTVAISSDVARDLDGVAAAVIKRIIPNLNLLADLLHADVLLFARAGTLVEVLAHAQPSPVPSVYQDTLTGRRLRPEQVRPIAQTLFHGRARHDVQGAVV